MKPKEKPIAIADSPVVVIPGPVKPRDLYPSKDIDWRVGVAVGGFRGRLPVVGVWIGLGTGKRALVFRTILHTRIGRN